jgi:hypothetical protein
MDKANAIADSSAYEYT